MLTFSSSSPTSDKTFYAMLIIDEISWFRHANDINVLQNKNKFQPYALGPFEKILLPASF